MRRRYWIFLGSYKMRYNFNVIRKILVVGTGIVSVSTGLALYFSESICSASNITCIDTLVLLLSPVLPAFIFSLITYFMRDAVHKAWARFSLVFVPVSMLLILITPESGGGGFGPSISFGKGDTAFLASVLFVLISMGIIIVQYIRTRRA